MNRFNPSALLWDIGVAIAVAATVLVVDYLPEPVLPDDPIARSEHLLAAGMPAEAEEALLPWFLDRLDSVEAHRRFLATHFRIPEHSATQQRDDDWIETLYRDDLASSAGHRHDVVTYGYGLFAADLEDYDIALEGYAGIQDQELPHLHSSRGAALLALDRRDEAAREFQRERALRHDVAGAVRGLARIDLDRHAW